MAGFQDAIPLIADGEAVNAAVTNRPIGAIDSNTRYLLSLINAINAGAALFERGVLVEAGAAVGMPVYWNSSTQQYERALAGAAISTDGTMAYSAASQVWGIVFSKLNAINADIVVLGTVELDLTLATSSTSAGVYYLSPVTPGHLTTTRPGLAIPVLRSNGAGTILFTPVMRDHVDNHTHYRFPLTAYPAGTTSPPADATPHVISSPDPTLHGWLPASHSIFNGNAPAGAAFGYNLSVDTALAAMWPPLPLSSAMLTWNQAPPVTATAATGKLQAEVPLGPAGMCIIDNNGIWWMANCKGDSPWLPTLDTSSPPSPPTNGACPRVPSADMVLWFIRPDFTSEGTAVTSLTSTDSRLVIHCASGGAGATGPLVASLNLTFTSGPDTALGYLVYKSFSGQNFQRGAVLEGLIAGTGVSFSGGVTRYLTPSDDMTAVVYQGIPTISVAAPTGLEFPVDLVDLSDATEESYNGVKYLGLPYGRPTSYRGRITLPKVMPAGTLTMTLRFYILGTVAAALPALTLTYARLAKPSAPLTPTALPGDDTTLTLSTTVTLGTPYTYVEAVSAGFTVLAGEVIYFTLGRKGSSPDVYNGELGILLQSGSIAIS